MNIKRIVTGMMAGAAVFSLVPSNVYAENKDAEVVSEAAYQQDYSRLWGQVSEFDELGRIRITNSSVCTPLALNSSHINNLDPALISSTVTIFLVLYGNTLVSLLNVISLFPPSVTIVVVPLSFFFTESTLT